MITLVVGDNTYVRDTTLARLRAAFDGAPEYIDGESVQMRDLPELFRGLTLFAPQRLVVIRELSQSKAAWEALPEYLDTSDDVHVVLVESNLDKRTRTYKQLAKSAEVVQAAPLQQRDQATAIKWLQESATAHGIDLSRQQALHMVERALIAGDRPGQATIDQGLLAQALEVLAIKGTVLDEDIARVLPPTPQENVFELLTAALQRQPSRVDEMVRVLSAHQEAYMALGLLSGQVAQLAALKFATKSPADVAAELGTHPYAMSKLSPLARNLSTAELQQIVIAFANADDRIKSSATDPWTILWHALTTIARR